MLSGGLPTAAWVLTALVSDQRSTNETNTEQE
jgi:hypothetical protein